MFRKYGEKEYYNNDMVNSLKLNHLDMTFEPCFLSAVGGKYMGDRIAHHVAAAAGGGGVDAFTGWRAHLALEFREGVQPGPFGEGSLSMQDAMDVFAMPPPQHRAAFVHPDDVFIGDGDDGEGGPAKRARAGESFLSRFLERQQEQPMQGAAGMLERPAEEGFGGMHEEHAAEDGFGGMHEEHAATEEFPPLVISGAMRGEPGPPPPARRRRKLALVPGEEAGGE